MKIAVSGTHGTGKSTKVMELARRLKIERPNSEVGMLMEVARSCPGPLNKAATEGSQLWIFAEQIRRELEMMRPIGCYDCLITDRSIMDNVAYSKVLGLPIWRAMFELATIHAGTYDRIIFNLIATNDHWHNDGVRECNDKVFRQRVEDELIRLYAKAQIKVELV